MASALGPTRVTVAVSASLRAIRPELAERQQVEFAAPPTIAQVLERLGIPPILVVAAVVEGRKMGLDRVLAASEELVLLGPVAGG